MASVAPEVLIAHLASATTRIRIGSDGVMLPHYSSVKVAESFNTLEALNPDRIDLGFGRAPGANQRFSAALQDLPEGKSASSNRYARRALPRPYGTASSAT